MSNDKPAIPYEAAKLALRLHFLGHFINIEHPNFDKEYGWMVEELSTCDDIGATLTRNLKRMADARRASGEVVLDRPINIYGPADMDPGVSEKLTAIVRPDLNDDQWDELMRQKCSQRVWENVQKLNETSPPGTAYMFLTDENGYATCGGHNCGICATCYDTSKVANWVDRKHLPLYFPQVVPDPTKVLDLMQGGGLRRGQLAMLGAMRGGDFNISHKSNFVGDLLSQYYAGDLEVDVHKPWMVSLENTPHWVPGLGGLYGNIGHVSYFHTRPKFPSTVSRLYFEPADVNIKCEKNGVYVGDYRAAEYHWGHSEFLASIKHSGKFRESFFSRNASSGRYFDYEVPDLYKYPASVQFGGPVRREQWAEDAIDKLIHKRLYGEPSVVWNERLGCHVELVPVGALKRTVTYNMMTNVTAEKEKARRLLKEATSPKRGKRGY